MRNLLQSANDCNLRHNHIIAMEGKHVSTKALLNEGVETAVNVGYDSSDNDSSLHMSKDGDDGAGEHDAGLY
jgi:hypothetical protein